MNIFSYIKPRPIRTYIPGGGGAKYSGLPLLLPLLFFLALVASPASAQTFTFNLNSSSQLNYSATVQLSWTGGCTNEGTWTISWGDGTSVNPTATQINQPHTHNYANAGSYTISYTYDCFQFGNPKTATVSVTFSTVIPASPTSVTVAPLTGIASWTEHTGAPNYRLELQIGTTGSVSTLLPGGHKTDVNFTTATNATNCCVKDTAYRTRIQVIGSKLTSLWSDDWTSFTFTGTTSFTGTPFSVSISLDYSQSAGALQITTGASGGSGDFGVNKCKVDDGDEFDCPTGVTSRALPAGAEYTVTVAGTRGHEKHKASATIDVPATVVPEVPEVPEVPPSISNGPRSGRSGAIVTQDSAPAPTPTVDRSRLPAGAEVRSQSPWVSFSEVSGAAISNPSVRNAALSAIDVAGPLGVNAEVCFDGAGSLLLLDTAYSPRRLVWLDAWQRADGKTCAWLDRAGTVALMPGQSPAAQTPQPTATATPNPYLIADSLDLLRTLDNCMVSSVVILNFRESPAGRILNWYAGASVALARTPNWFKVSYLGKEGFISAHFVTTDGDCD